MDRRDVACLGGCSRSAKYDGAVSKNKTLKHKLITLWQMRLRTGHQWRNFSADMMYVISPWVFFCQSGSTVLYKLKSVIRSFCLEDSPRGHWQSPVWTR